MNELNIMLLLPEIFLALTGLGFLIVGVFQGNRSTDVLAWSSCVSFVIAGLLILQAGWVPNTILGGMLTFNAFSAIMKLLILLGLIVSLALSVKYLYRERIARFEYPVLVIFAGIGMLLMVSANSFLSLYMALELQSLALYILAAFHRNSVRSSEAAAKYFILGALSSGLLLFGISLIYGFTGSVDFEVIKQTMASLEAAPPGFIVGMVFVLAAIGFKISAAPFHMWTPDVYQGAPTSVTALFAIVPKVAAVAVLLKLLYIPFSSVQDQWGQILYVLCLFSLVVGAFAPIAQKNLKRLFAYSSIGNMGYVMIGVMTGTITGISAVITFLFIYVIMTFGVFTIILCLRRDGKAVENMDDLSGLSRTRPLLAYSMTVLMLSMIGIPPLAGFFGKFFVFAAAVDAQMYVLAVVGILASVVAAFYYLRIIKVMFFDEPVDLIDKEMGLEKRILLLLSIGFTLLFIFKPHALLDIAQSAAQALL